MKRFFTQLKEIIVYTNKSRLNVVAWICEFFGIQNICYLTTSTTKIEELMLYWENLHL